MADRKDYNISPNYNIAPVGNNVKTICEKNNFHYRFDRLYCLTYISQIY